MSTNSTVRSFVPTLEALESRLAPAVTVTNHKVVGGNVTAAEGVDEKLVMSNFTARAAIPGSVLTQVGFRAKNPNDFLGIDSVTLWGDFLNNRTGVRRPDGRIDTMLGVVRHPDQAIWFNFRRQIAPWGMHLVVTADVTPYVTGRVAIGNPIVRAMAPHTVGGRVSLRPEPVRLTGAGNSPVYTILGSDLSISMTGLGVLNVGETGVYRVVVSNNGPIEETDAVIHLFTSLDYVPSVSSNWSASPFDGYYQPHWDAFPFWTRGFYSINAGRMMPGETKTFDIGFSSDHPETLPIGARVWGAYDDMNLADNSGQTSIDVVNPTSAKSDVSIFTAGPDQVHAGEFEAYGFAVLNSGPETATDVFLRVYFPVGSVLDDILDRGWTVFGDGVFQLALGDLLSGQSASAGLGVIVPNTVADPDFKVIAMITMKNDDPVLENNTKIMISDLIFSI